MLKSKRLPQINETNNESAVKPNVTFKLAPEYASRSTENFMLKIKYPTNVNSTTGGGGGDTLFKQTVGTCISAFTTEWPGY